MNIAIKEAEEKYVTVCADILQNTEIGTVYFSDYKKTVDLLLRALEQRELFVALNDNEDCLGFMYFVPKGVFGNYPYLHIIAVKEECRNLGIGKQLINTLKRILLTILQQNTFSLWMILIHKQGNCTNLWDINALVS